MATPFTQGHFDVTIAFLVPENVDFGILYAIPLTFWIKLYVLKAAILDAILNLTHSARDPDCPPKFFTYLGLHYQDQESK